MADAKKCDRCKEFYDIYRLKTVDGPKPAQTLISEWDWPTWEVILEVRGEAMVPP